MAGDAERERAREVGDPQERQRVLRTFARTLGLFAMLFAAGGLSNLLTPKGSGWNYRDLRTRRHIGAGMALVAVAHGGLLVASQLLFPQILEGFVVQGLFALGFGVSAWRLHREREAL